MQKPTSASVSGKLTIAYIDEVDGMSGRQQDAWLWTEGESPIRLTTSGNVTALAISADGQYVAFTRQTAWKTDLPMWNCG
jgi:hypothetical protein